MKARLANVWNNLPIRASKQSEPSLPQQKATSTQPHHATPKYLLLCCYDVAMIVAISIMKFINCHVSVTCCSPLDNCRCHRSAATWVLDPFLHLAHVGIWTSILPKSHQLYTYTNTYIVPKKKGHDFGATVMDTEIHLKQRQLHFGKYQHSLIYSSLFGSQGTHLHGKARFF